MRWGGSFGCGRGRLAPSYQGCPGCWYFPETTWLAPMRTDAPFPGHVKADSSTRTSLRYTIAPSPTPFPPFLALTVLGSSSRTASSEEACAPQRGQMYCCSTSVSSACSGTARGALQRGRRGGGASPTAGHTGGHHAAAGPHPWVGTATAARPPIHLFLHAACPPDPCRRTHTCLRSASRMRARRRRSASFTRG